MTKPYTYVIGWPELETYYYGVRYANNCHPQDLLTTYFTSSKHVKKFIEENGLPTFKQIRKTFETKKEACDWEDKVLKRMNIVKHSKFLNRTTNRGIPPELCPIHLKGKTYEEAYGKEKAKELRQKRSESNRNRAGKVSYTNNGNYGKSNLQKVCCLGCGKETHLPGLGRHKKKCFYK